MTEVILMAEHYSSIVRHRTQNIYTIWRFTAVDRNGLKREADISSALI
jgi:hypothetical protein